MFVENISYTDRVSDNLVRIRRMEVMDLLFFDFRASMLLIHPHVFLILVKLESKSFKWYRCAQILRCKIARNDH